MAKFTKFSTTKQGVRKISNIFGDKLKNLRLKSGLTQAQLADKLDVSASTVGMYEQGRREPDNHILAKICHELGTSGDYLLNIDNSNFKLGKEDVYNIISDFINFLENQNDLMFNGEPINNLEKKRIASALKIATAVTMSELKDINK